MSIAIASLMILHTLHNTPPLAPPRKRGGENSSPLSVYGEGVGGEVPKCNSPNEELLYNSIFKFVLEINKVIYSASKNPLMVSAGILKTG
jgi:hypothetical protein